MDSSLSTLSEICISFAPAEEPVIEAYSPFSATCVTSIDDNAFRSIPLTPPILTKSSKATKPLSPLRPFDSVTTPRQGLEQERFETLLQAARGRNLVLGSKKGCDLRKEITLKAHKNKQVERRALFLYKVLAPPSPMSVLTPKAPPESPAVFHYSLPSPRLISPIALFESLSEHAENGSLSCGYEAWAEPVDLRTFQYTVVKVTPSHISPPPSLDQISAHMTSRTHSHLRVNEVPAVTLCPTVAFERPRLQTGVGRLQMPIRAAAQATDSDLRKLYDTLEPQVDATISSVTQSNLSALSSREHRAHNMLSTLRRRTSLIERSLEETEPEVFVHGAQWKRHSAPGDLLPPHQRYPVLCLPGGF